MAPDATDFSWSAVYRLAEPERGGNARPASRRRRFPARLPVERQASLARSAIFTGFFSITLLRAAMPVRHDIAPARESGSCR